VRIDHLILNQLKIASKVRIQRIKTKIRFIAGTDVSVRENKLVGCIGVFSYPGLVLSEYSCATSTVSIPYIPGFLSFREIPVLLRCYRKLRIKPDMILVDGQGIAHPRAVGLAAHLGVLLNTPTIGCAKSHLYGSYTLPGKQKGNHSSLRDDTKEIGLVLRTRNNTKPLFVSPGHLTDIDDCRAYVLSTTVKYRIPEPIRFAHKTAGDLARRINVRS
jgi:deoxyribonuclease V